MISYTRAATKNPASAPSFKASVSEAKGLLVTLFSFLKCQLIGTTKIFSPFRSTINVPWDDSIFNFEQLYFRARQKLQIIVDPQGVCRKPSNNNSNK